MTIVGNEPTIPVGDDETVAGHVVCHCSEDDGVPDVGVSIGLGGGKSLWLGELLRRDGGDLGFVLHGPNDQRDVAPIWPNCEWQDVADILRHHVAPALARPSVRDGECERLREALLAVRACRVPPMRGTDCHGHNYECGPSWNVSGLTKVLPLIDAALSADRSDQVSS